MAVQSVKTMIRRVFWEHCRNACSVLTVRRWLHAQRGARSSISSLLTQLITGISFQKNVYKSDHFLLFLASFGRKYFKVKEKTYTSAKDSLQKIMEGGNNPSGSSARIPEASKWYASANKASHLSGAAEWIPTDGSGCQGIVYHTVYPLWNRHW